MQGRRVAKVPHWLAAADIVRGPAPAFDGDFKVGIEQVARQRDVIACRREGDRAVGEHRRANQSSILSADRVGRVARVEAVAIGQQRDRRCRNRHIAAARHAVESNTDRSSTRADGRDHAILINSSHGRIAARPIRGNRRDRHIRHAGKRGQSLCLLWVGRYHARVERETY